MDARFTHTTDEDVWADPMFHQASQFDDSMNTDSPYASTAFNDFTNLDSYADSPGLALRTPSKSGPDAAAAAGAQNPNATPKLHSHASAESSSQDSASDSSSRRKRKVASESPMSDAMTEQPVKQEETILEDLNEGQKMQHFEQNFTRPMHHLTLEQDDNNMFDFGGAGSSPTQVPDYSQSMSMNAQVHMPTTTMAPQYQHSPVRALCAQE